jgi:hypothetical protein
MRTPKKTLRAVLFIFAVLALPLQSRAQGDDTNAAKITDLDLWASMSQVMGGTSKETPDRLLNPLSIRTPQGIYAYVLVDTLVTTAMSSGIDKDTALGNYFNFLLSQPEISGLLFAAPWSLLNPNDPAIDPSTAYDWSTLDDAIGAAIATGKNLQLNVSPGFSSPEWLYVPPFVGGSGYLRPCDQLFVHATPPVPIVLQMAGSSCGYTTIFVQTEVAASKVGPATLPLPWNPTYKSKWKAFLHALWNHIKSKKSEKYIVSIAVAGPTATSSEMILPNGVNQSKYTPLQVPWAPLGGYSANAGINAQSAWNCLLANAYGVKSSYLNANRAFIEEWAAAIDMFGEIFSGLTLTVATGNGLPEFHPSETMVPGCGLNGISLPPQATTKLLTNSPPAFLPDCGSSPLHPMDCAAETAILAYFAEPPVGGPNAKATQENALSASDDVVNTLLSLSNASVKWLSHVTAGGLATMQGVQGAKSKSMPIVSRMLGGLQFAQVASNSNTVAQVGCQQGQCPSTPGYCASVFMSMTGCSQLSATAPAEQALHNALKVFFAGTPGASVFHAPTTVMNNGTTVKNASIDYLQIWAGDIKYAAGYGFCSDKEIMTNSTMTCYAKQPQPMPTVKIGSTTYNAQGLLNLASGQILTPVALPLFGYNKCKDKVPTCKGTYQPRGAFDGDLVCVSKSDENAAKSETKDGTSSTPSKNHYSKNATYYPIKPVVPYGVCDGSHVWRQAYMGDYVCVSLMQHHTVAEDNTGAAKNVECPK